MEIAETKVISTSDDKLNQIIDSKQIDELFNQLLSTLFESTESNLFNSSSSTKSIKKFQLNQKSVIALCAWFNRDNDEFLKTQYAVFNNYIDTDHTKTIWLLLYNIETHNFYNYQHQKYPGISLYVLQNKADVNNTQPVIIINETERLCSLCGHFTTLKESCIHLLHCHLSQTVLSPPIVRAVNEETFMDLIERSIVE
jgi:hypothetical protein